MRGAVGRLVEPLRATETWRHISAALSERGASRHWRGSVDDVVAYHRARVARSDERAGERALCWRVLSDRTWSDLELESVFARMGDRCGCPLGQQVLHDLMRRPVVDPLTVSRRDELIRAISNRPQAEVRIARAANLVATSAAYDLFRLTDEELPERPKWYLLFPALGITAVVAILERHAEFSADRRRTAAAGRRRRGFRRRARRTGSPRARR